MKTAPAYHHYLHPFTPDAVEKLVTNSSPVLDFEFQVDKKTQEIKVEESLEEKVLMGKRLHSPVEL